MASGSVPFAGARQRWYICRPNDRFGLFHIRLMILTALTQTADATERMLVREIHHH